MVKDDEVTTHRVCDMQKKDDDEFDYMSDTFLQELKDVKPGLLNREGKRKLKVRLMVLGVGRGAPSPPRFYCVLL